MGIQPRVKAAYCAELGGGLVDIERGAEGDNLPDQIRVFPCQSAGVYTPEAVAYQADFALVRIGQFSQAYLQTFKDITAKPRVTPLLPWMGREADSIQVLAQASSGAVGPQKAR